MPPTTSVLPNITGISDFFSIDPVNAVIALLSLLLSGLATFYAIKADRKANRASKKANQIGEMQRIDGLMPNISIPVFKTFGSLFTNHYPHLRITSVDDLPAIPNQYRLNNGSDILKNELEWIIKMEMSITNSTPNSASLSIEIDGFDKKELTICGSANGTITFDVRQIVPTLQMAQSLVGGDLSLSYKITCKGIGTKSHDVISGKFKVKYNADFAAQSLSDTFLESSRNREYVYDV